MKFLLSSIIICCLLSCNSEIKYPKGGYDYPKASEVTDTNFYFYPLRHVLTKTDSLYNTHAYGFYQIFNEPNLSIKPQGYDVFRLRYLGGAMSGVTIMITLTKDGITVKKRKGGPYDLSKLSEIEHEHFDFMERYYPFTDTIKRSKNTRKRHDSLIKVYPQLLDPKYYVGLASKTINTSNPHFSYTTKKVTLSEKDYQYLVMKINTSGYWGLPYEIAWPAVVSTDVGNFSLEANTKNKYNMVNAIEEIDDTSKFKQACKELVRYAGMEKEIYSLSEHKATTNEPPVIIKDVPLEQPRKKRKH